MAKEEDIREVLGRKLRALDGEISAAEKKLDPVREERRRLQSALAALDKGAMGSGAMSDEDFVAGLRSIGATKRSPKLATEIASALDLDTRGISRRLPRMVNDGLLGGTKDAGYYVP